MYPDTPDPAADSPAGPDTEPHATLDPLDESYVPPPKEASIWEDFVDVFFSPSELFARRRDARWGKPMFALIVVSVLLYLAFFNANQRIVMSSMEAAMAAQGNPEAAAALNDPAASTMMTAIGVVGVPVMMLVWAAWTAILLWGIGRLLDVRPTFRQSMVIGTYALYVLLVAQVISALIVTLKGPGELNAVRELSFGLARFMENPLEMQGSVLALVQRVDLFAIWQAVLWGVGLRAMLGVSRGKAMTVAAVAWVVFALPQVVIGAFTGGAPGG